MSTRQNDAERDHRNLINRRRRQEVTLFRKAHKLHTQGECEVYIVIHHRDNDHYTLYNSEPDEEFPRPYERLKTYYPKPEINTPSRPQATLIKALAQDKAGHGDADVRAPDPRLPAAVDPMPPFPQEGEVLDMRHPVSPVQDIDELPLPPRGPAPPTAVAMDVFDLDKAPLSFRQNAPAALGFNVPTRHTLGGVNPGLAVTGPVMPGNTVQWGRNNGDGLDAFDRRRFVPIRFDIPIGTTRAGPRPRPSALGSPINFRGMAETTAGGDDSSYAPRRRAREPLELNDTAPNKRARMDGAVLRPSAASNPRTALTPLTPRRRVEGRQMCSPDEPHPSSRAHQVAQPNIGLQRTRDRLGRFVMQ